MHMHADTQKKVRVAAATMVVVMTTLAAAGCFEPKIKNRAFACDPAVPDNCPQGFYCRAGFCDDGSGGGDRPMGPDLATGGGGGGGGGEDMSLDTTDMSGGAGDLSSTGPADLARVPDLARPPDMARCKDSFEPCSKDSECCDNFCFFDGTCF
jgi:hypothetical protein